MTEKKTSANDRVARIQATDLNEPPNSVLESDTSVDSSTEILADAASKQDSLDDHAKPVWQAYTAMFESKQRHYEYLELLENKKKKFNIQPSEKDKAQLADYLGQHDTQVKAFTQMSIELKHKHPESHKNLFAFIAQLVDGEPSTSTEH